jgi:tRNA (mo5U34)-methyltransferase
MSQEPTVLLKAIDAAARRDFAAAAALFAVVDPMDDQVRYSLGLCRFAAGDTDAGLDLMREAFVHGRPGMMPLVPLRVFSEELRAVVSALAASGDAATRLRIAGRLAGAEALHQLGRTSEARDAFVGLIRDLRPEGQPLLAANTDEATLRASVAPSPVWHSVDLGSTFVEGRKTARTHAGELVRFDLPDLRGKSVLDIGAFDGFYSFEAERRGASRVTALDYHSWVSDLGRLSEFATEYRKTHAATPDLYAPPESYVDREGLPGRRAFDAARAALGSRVEPVCRDFRDLVADELGVFDVTLFLGVLYHLTDPFSALQKVAAVTGEVAVIETLGVHVPSAGNHPVWEFYKDDRVNQDQTTWWAPTECALADMLEAAGFSRVEIKSGADTISPSARNAVTRMRIVAHAWK